MRAVGGLLLLMILMLPAGAAPPDQEPAPASDEVGYVTESIRGRIVWMYEALERRYGIKSVPEARERLLALETPAGRLYPLVDDLRGRSFRLDTRLRELTDCELFVRRYEGSPMVQVIRIYSHERGRKYEVDYWCDICAIAMFELKACDCCQGPIQLRRRPGNERR